ncbi:carbohydrate-binding family 9-like protein [Algibacter sp. PT7-4]|uniref:carbohydrate-binding family 9-like protein n=1 Tax=Algibacter ulvanivorans TaxID=3400999 RepID=UPI003AAFD8B8
MKTYNVNFIDDKEFAISGNGNHHNWNKASSLTDFSSPWDNKPIHKVEFKALHNLEKVFFLFTVHDSQTYIHQTANINNSINNSDRVELFFRTNASLNPYYCLEIDSTSRIMDFLAKPNKQFNFNWKWPINDIVVKSSVQSRFFTVEIAINKSSLTKLGVLRSNRIETGIYRAKYNKQKNETFKPTWITWVNPKTDTPNFHTPSSFGVLELL